MNNAWGTFCLSEIASPGCCRYPDDLTASSKSAALPAIHCTPLPFHEELGSSMRRARKHKLFWPWKVKRCARKLRAAMWSFKAAAANSATIYGSQGRIFVPDSHAPSEVTLYQVGQPLRTVQELQTPSAFLPHHQIACIVEQPGSILDSGKAAA